MERAAMLEWTGVAVLLLGCACITAGVMAFDVNIPVAWTLIIIGVVVALIGVVGWISVVKIAARRQAEAN